MEFKTLVRGMGKIYLSLDVSVPEGCDMRSTSCLDDGAEVASAVVRDRRDDSAPIVVLPILKASQTVEVSLVDADGAVLESASRRIRPLAAAAESKLAARLKRDEVLHLRDADLSPSLGEAWVHVNRIVEDEQNGNAETVRLTVKTLVKSKEQAKAACIVSAFDQKGAAVPLENQVILFDSALERRDDEPPFIRELGISVRCAGTLASCFLEVRFADPPVATGFVFVDPANDHRVRWAFCGPYNHSGNGSRYHDWFLEHHRASGQELAVQRATRFPAEPMFSLIVPLYRTPTEYFREMADSVLSQTYGNLELLLVNASPDDQGLRAVVQEYRARDNRVVVVDLQENRGITLNTNEGIRVARGDFLCFCDHDDTLEPNLLFEYAKAINEHPDIDLLYCDEDKLFNGRYEGGYKKPDFDPTLICAVNLVTHLLTVRKSVIDSLEELPGKEYDGSQDHNLTLWVSERARNIHHVRKILYHWRVHPASTAANADAKPWTVEAGRLAITEHLNRLGEQVEVVSSTAFPNVHFVEHPLPEPPPMISVVVAADDVARLRRCISSVTAMTAYRSYETVIAWKGDDDELESACETAGLGRYGRVSWRDGETRYVALNHAAAMAAGAGLLFMGQDVQVTDGRWMELLVRQMCREGVAACGPRLLYADDLVRQAGIVMSAGGPVRIAEYVPRDSGALLTLSRLAREVSALEADCMLVERSAFEEVGGFDDMLQSELASVDLCFKLARAGYVMVMEPHVELYWHSHVPGSRALHVGEPAPGAGEAARIRHAAEKGVMLTRWPDRYGQVDPHYNDGFSAGPVSFALDYPRDSMSYGLDSGAL